MRRVFIGAALALAAIWSGAPVQAADDFTAGQVMDRGELEEVRGGILTPTGLEIGFGAVVRTFVDGSLVLQTRLTWSDTGPVETIEYGSPLPDISAAAAAGGVKIEGPALPGLVINGDGGVTAIAHSIGADHIGNLVINNANNRDIRQSTDITLQIPALAQMQADVAMQALDLRLQDAMRVALRDAAAP